MNRDALNIISQTQELLSSAVNTGELQQTTSVVVHETAVLVGRVQTPSLELLWRDYDQ